MREEIGALWINSKDGKTYISGIIRGERVMIFKNSFKKALSKQPDYKVYKSEVATENKEDDNAF